jgi:uncharacterized protein YfaT (DUF1175 family)
VRLLACCALAILAPGVIVAGAQVRLRTESDRAALRAWFVVLADAQFYRPTADVTDCAGLVRHALREGLRPHTADWLRRARLPAPTVAPEILDRPIATAAGVPLFRTGSSPGAVAEFADAHTIVRFNTTRVGRDVTALRPGDLLYFRQDGERLPDHLMVFVGASPTAPERRDWVVYHTGPDDGSTGEVRKVALADLRRHPSPRWRPDVNNAAFAGVYRLQVLW